MSTAAWYSQYLQQDHWRSLRLAKLEDAGHRCNRCPSKQRLEVHHIRYAPYREKLTDLEVLCEDCHEQVHFLEKTKGKTVPVKVETSAKVRSAHRKTSKFKAALRQYAQAPTVEAEALIIRHLANLSEVKLRSFCLSGPSRLIRKEAFAEMQRRKSQQV